MPIFEYRCSDCNSTFELLVKGKNEDEILCPECKSSNNKKLFSAFATSANTSSASFDSCATGNCNIDTPSAGSCAGGMCGLN